MPLFRPPRPLTPTLRLKLGEARDRTDRFIVAHPKGSGHRHGAMIRLAELTKSGTMTAIPYDVFNPKKLWPIEESRPIFQLLQAIQALAEWQLVQPEDVTIDHIIGALDKVGTDALVFPDCDATPRVHRLLVGIPFFETEKSAGWTLRLENDPTPRLLIEGDNFIIREDLPLNVFFDRAIHRWDVRPT